MIRTDLHIHTTYGDGRNTPEEMVLSAITMGMERIGFSEHSSVPFDPLEGMTGDNVRKYIDEISGLKEKYRGRIEILCGIEQDFYSEQDVSAFDYVIGSVHYLKRTEYTLQSMIPRRYWSRRSQIIMPVILWLSRRTISALFPLSRIRPEPTS